MNERLHLSTFLSKGLTISAMQSKNVNLVHSGTNIYTNEFFSGHAKEKNSMLIWQLSQTESSTISLRQSLIKQLKRAAQNIEEMYERSLKGMKI